MGISRVTRRGLGGISKAGGTGAGNFAISGGGVGRVSLAGNTGAATAPLQNQITTPQFRRFGEGKMAISRVTRRGLGGISKAGGTGAGNFAISGGGMGRAW